MKLLGFLIDLAIASTIALAMFALFYLPNAPKSVQVLTCLFAIGSASFATIFRPRTERRLVTGMRKPAVAVLLVCALTLSACTQSELSQFKTYWNGGVNAVIAFDNTIQNNPKISQDTKDKSHVLATKLGLSKPIVKEITVFPPADRQALSDLLKETIPLLQDFAGDGSLGVAITIAASAALAFFQTESDMLDSAGSARSVSAGAALPNLKAKLDKLKEAVKAIK